MIVVRSGSPARVLAVLAPAIAVGLVVGRALLSGLSSRPEDPVSPWIVAVVTIAVGFWLGWRAPSQRAELRPDELRSRNLTTTFSVEWDRIEAILVERRGPLSVVDIRAVGMRRRLRIGAATRFTGDGPEVVLDMFRAHPMASDLLLEHHDS